MNPPSLREICAKAMESRPTLAGYLSTWTPTRTFTKDESALAARFSPATALAVYEALERVTSEYPPSRDGMDGNILPVGIKSCRRAMALLDGRTEP